MLDNLSEDEICARLADIELKRGDLDWSVADAAAVVTEMKAIIESFIESRVTAPAYLPEGEDIAACIDDAQPCGPATAVKELATVLASSGIDTASSRFMGYVPGGGLPTAAAATFVSTLLNRYVGIYGAAPAAARIENDSLTWLCSLYNLPASAWGAFCSGGSVATITGFLAARDARPKESHHRLVCYMTTEAHVANRRALHVLGIPKENVRVIAVDSSYRMDISALRASIASDLAGSLIPWMVVATAGTTNTGAIDPLDAIADVCANEGLWFHVDAAYGGLFRLVGMMESKLAGLSRVDSLVVDPHKAMFLPYGCGVVLVADGEHLRRSLAGEGDVSYLSDVSMPGCRSANDYSVELTRPSRGAQVWAVLRAHGREAITQALEEKLLLTRWLRENLQKNKSFEVVAGDLTVVAFRLREGDDATRRLLRQLTASGRYLLSSTVVEGKLFLRCCILCFRTHRRDVEGLAQALLEARS